MFRAGQQVGIYTLVSRIGRGGFGEVWLAERRATYSTTRVAVKLPLEEQVDHAAIKNEAELWVQASGHANVLPIIEANDYDGQVVIVSEYAPDGSLEDLLKATSTLAVPLKTTGDLITVWSRKDGRGGDVEYCKLSVPKAVEMLHGILSGLKYLHDKRIIHRDLKPANILLQGETPRLADFGISRAVRTSNSLTPNIAGTPRYMAPEAFNGQRNARTDIWSIGVLFYQTLTGTLPFPQEHYGELLSAIMTGAPAPLPDAVPAGLQRVVLKALSNNPARRYQTTEEFRAELKQAYQRPIETPSVIATPPTVIEPEPLAFDLPATLKVAKEPSAELWATPETAQPEPASSAHFRPSPAAEKPPASTRGLASGEPAVPTRGELERPSLITSEAPSHDLMTEVPGQETAVTPTPVHRKALTAFLLLPLLLSVALVGFFTTHPTLPRTTETNFARLYDEFAALAPDGGTLALGGGKDISLLDAASGRELKLFKGHAFAVGRVAFSRDGKMLVSAEGLLPFNKPQPSDIKLWDVASGFELTKLPAGSDHTGALALSPDGKMLAVVENVSNILGPLNGRVKLWDLTRGLELRTLEHGVEIGAIAFAPDGKTLVAGGANVKLWDVASGAEVKTLTEGGKQTKALAYSPNGRTLAVLLDVGDEVAGTRGTNGGVRLWDVASGRQTKLLGSTADGLASVAFSSDGSKVAAGGYDNTVKLWDVASGREVKRLFGHSRVVNAVAFASDGSKVSSMSEDGTVKLWDAQVPEADPLQFVFILAAAWVLTIVIHTFGMGAAGLLVGAPLEEVGIFVGPRLFGLTLRGVRFSFLLIPTGGFVRFAEEGFQAMSTTRRFAIACSGELSLVLVALAAFGLNEGVDKFFGGFWQVLAGAFSPLAVGSVYLLAVYEFARANPFWLVTGLISAKVAAFNLLPVPVLNGGTIALTLTERFLSLFGVALRRKVREQIQQIGFIVTLLLMALWLVALITFLGRLLT